MEKKIAVVILNWNGKKLLEQFLPSVLSYSDQAKVYVADNASTDDSVSFINQHYPQIEIIRNAENFGFAKGYNEAIKNVKEPYLVLLNSDVEVTANWLDGIEDIFENEPQTVALQPKILDFKNKQKFEYAGAAGGFIDKYAFPFCRGRIFSSIEQDLGQYNEPQTIFWVSGACMVIRKQIFEQLGGFDADFFAHQEEIDLCWRIYNKGFTVKYIPQSVVYHVGGATLNEQSPKKTFLNFRNSLYTLLKNHPNKGLFLTFFLRLCLDGIAGVFFLLRLKPLHTLAIVKSHFAVYANMDNTLKKRYKTQKSDYYYTTSIVFDYYLFRKKTFSKIDSVSSLK